MIPNLEETVSAQEQQEKPVLYCYRGSVWSAASELAVEELGLQEKVERKPVDLLEGENLKLKYVTKSAETQSTIPALTTPDGTLYASTVDVVRHLISIAPVNAKPDEATSRDVLEFLHADEVDPNFFKMAARNEIELETIADSRKQFVHNRQEVLNSVAPVAPTRLKDFYNDKLAVNTDLDTIFQGTASNKVLQAYFQKSQENWDAITELILNVLPEYIPEHGFIGGAVPGEADFHLGAYLARIAAVLERNNGIGGGSSCFKAFGDVPQRLFRYWDAWVLRESWNVVYKGGIH